jgi:8-oxo-dGTP pyrophosphatase MutT (NUDIX family)
MKNFFEDLIIRYTPQSLAETPNSAAVLILIMLDELQNPFIILTKRPDDISSYAGDYCFPGGRKEAEDQNFKQTVVREVEEELGLKAMHYHILGQLDDFQDRFGNLVRPFVAKVSKKNFLQNHKKISDEIVNIYYFPLAELQNIKIDDTLEKITKRSPTYIYHNEEVLVWGLTASIMVHLSNILFNLNKKVSYTVVTQ